MKPSSCAKTSVFLGHTPAKRNSINTFIFRCTKGMSVNPCATGRYDNWVRSCEI
ncbi:uncharacterized protein FOMMEDRAFT_143125 [Fomitiporia mediterranea MF3/22]|uniref:uncharacterized protein n=1 Tax=Fomitiporia mediterranea (strain MF3/22) TaxID=694068 RepID=UPI0004407D4A|nr:uncharacterized protein FOMMEDRAFT_143125 [Fomitiporia mediterranea MF3/22]EJC98737.1 hypothetical protein FOMMEDRAFT_143125 [Fomitiporia mediterranea MF3/22]